MKEIRNKIRCPLELLAVFVAMYVSAGFYFENFVQTRYAVVAMLVVDALLVVVNGFHAGKRLWIGTGVLGGLCLLSSLLAGDPVKKYAFAAVSLVVAFIFVSALNFKAFKKRFVDVMVFISVLSILLELVYFIQPAWLDWVPVRVNKSGRQFYDCFFTTLSLHRPIRLQGIFWEPGAFQTFGGLALIFLIGEENNRYVFGKMLILLVAMGMTLSTTAYLVLILLMGALAAQDTIWLKNKWKNLLLCGIIGIVLLILVYPLMPKYLNGQRFGLGKLIELFEGRSSAGHHTSGSVRVDSVYWPMKLFFANPIFGAGYTGLESLHDLAGHSMMTCTITNYLAMYGVVVGCLVLACPWGLVRDSGKNRLQRLLLYGAFLCPIMSEDYANYTVMNILILYGMSEKRVDEGLLHQ